LPQLRHVLFSRTYQPARHRRVSQTHVLILLEPGVIGTHCGCDRLDIEEEGLVNKRKRRN